MNDNFFDPEPIEETKPKPIVLDPSQEKAKNDVLKYNDKHFFITGPAGCGKSTLLKEIKKELPKSVIVTPTGISAVNIGGQTIHSTFGIPPRIVTRGDAKKTENENRRKMLWYIEDIIIDEISMIRADVLDFVDEFLRLNCNYDKPFGGKRIIMFGDLDQLPPVVTQNEADFIYSIYQSPYFFSSTIMKTLPLNVRFLKTIHRQSNAEFIDLLNSIKKNEITDEQLEKINSRVIPNMESKLAITSTNSLADYINKEKLNSLKSPTYTFTAKLSGEFSESYTPAPLQLHLKVGAQVIHLVNSPERGLINGSRGIVVDISDEGVLVKFTNLEEPVMVGKYTWENKRYRFISHSEQIIENQVGNFEQLPLKLGFATTIHKSQGQTFDEVHINFGGGLFAPGQAYVALSRCKTLEGITLQTHLSRKDIIVDPSVVKFYKMIDKLNI